MAGPAARIVLSLMPEVEKLALVIVAIITLPFLLLALLFAGPIVIWERVPIVTPSQAKIYVDAAKEVSESTKSPCDPGVTVDWQPLLAIEAVRLNQDFRKATPARARDLARMFIKRKGTCTHCTGGDPPT